VPRPSQEKESKRTGESEVFRAFAEFRCVRDPQRAVILDARGQHLSQANTHSDVVNPEVSPNDLVHVQVEFS
jgi:hypothetical protein